MLLYRAGVVAATVLFLFSAQCQAHDLGTFGEIYEITEQDLFQRMAFEMSGHDAKSAVQERREAVNGFFNDAPKVTSLRRATQTTSFFVKHQMIVTSDFKVPVLVDKETDTMVQTPTKNISAYRVDYRYLARAGDTINPMESPAFTLTNHFLVFDPDDKRQKAMAIAAAKAFKQRLTLVTTHGDIIDLSKKAGQPVYLLYKSLKDIFKLERVPAFFGQSKLQGEKVMAVTEIGTDYQDERDIVDALKLFWSGPQNPEEAKVVTVTKQIDPQMLMRDFGGPSQ